MPERAQTLPTSWRRAEFYMGLGMGETKLRG